jgi:hypothetical protein
LVAEAWHDSYVPVVIVIVIAIVVVLAAVVLVAAGRGGEMPAAEPADYAPLELGPVSATDIVLLRPPTALWGYSQQATDEALERIAESVRERDVRIVALEQLVTDLSRESPATVPLGSPYPGARHARPEAGFAGPGFAGPAGTGAAFGPAGIGPEGTVPSPLQPGFGPGPLEDPGGGPLSAPVADPRQDAGLTQPGRDVPPWVPGAGGPPEIAHD